VLLDSYVWIKILSQPELEENLEPQPADPLIKHYDDERLDNLVNIVKNTLNAKEEVSVTCFYYSPFLL
jgi:hypothetical protein